MNSKIRNDILIEALDQWLTVVSECDLTYISDQEQLREGIAWYKEITGIDWRSTNDMSEVQS